MATLLQDRPLRSQRDAAVAREYDLRHRRDLFGRRFTNEVKRQVLRIAALVTLDSFAVTASAAVVIFVGNSASLTPFLPVLAILVITGQMAVGGYGAVREATSPWRILAGLVVSGTAIVALGSVDGHLRLEPVRGLVLFSLIALSMCSVRWCLAQVIQACYRWGVGLKNTLVIGAGSEAWRLVEGFRSGGRDEVNIIGHLAPVADQDPSAMGTLSDLPHIMEEYGVVNVLVSSHLDLHAFRQLVVECLSRGAAVSVVPSTLIDLPAKVSSRNALGWPLLELRVPRLQTAQALLKRGIDLLLSSLLLLLAAPLFGVIAAAIRMETRGPVLFRQHRPGLGGKPFAMLKFRSMQVDAELALRADERLQQVFLDNACKLPADLDPRITRVGRFLRRTSLDELPQLINVLKGDMSLVGPRPVVGPELLQYGDDAITLLSVRPGITGHWQVNGRSSVTYPKRAELDLEYIKRWSLGLDVKILLRTVPTIMSGIGAH